MKLKNLTVGAVASLLLVLFLPVFYKVVFVGNGINYNEEHKITTLYQNEVLLLCGAVAVVIIGVLYFLLRKVPFNRYTVWGAVIGSLILCVIFYFVSVKMAKCMAFYGGWDCGMVANSARWIFEGRDLGYEDYYTIYSNNIPITWLLYKLYQFANELQNYPYNPEFIWIQFQCAMFAAAIFFSAMTVLVISRKIATTVLVLVINTIFLGLSPWEIIPYTDAATIAVPVFLIFLYSLLLRCKSKAKYFLWFFIVFAGVLGGIMKATGYITLIAIVLIDFVWVFLQKETFLQKAKCFALRVVLLACGFVVASACKQGMYRTVSYEYNYDMEMTWSNYMYNGLNEATTGACSGEGLALVREYADCAREDRITVEIDYIKDRIALKGWKGLLDFWMRKQVMNFNDGTFSWYQEGFFNAWPYEDIIDSDWEEPLKDFYWEDGKDYPWFLTISQGIWLWVLAGVIVEAFMLLLVAAIGIGKRSTSMEAEGYGVQIRVIGITTFIGVFLFVMLFEGRARYLLNSIPVFSTLAVLGYCDFFDKTACLIGRILDKNVKKTKIP